MLTTDKDMGAIVGKLVNNAGSFIDENELALLRRTRHGAVDRNIVVLGQLLKHQANVAKSVGLWISKNKGWNDANFSL